MAKVAERLSAYFCVALLMCFAFMDMARASAKVIQGRYIVELEAPAALAQTTKQSAAAGKAQTHYRSMVQQQQRAFTEQIKKRVPTISVKRRFDTLLNGLEVSLDESELGRVLALPGVKRVYPVKMRYAHLDSSHQAIKSIEAWSQMGGQHEAGKGIKIAIIDSGIQPGNPMFDDTGFEAPDLSGNSWLSQNPDYCRMEGGDPDFCNNKVIIARVFKPEDDNFAFDSVSDVSPLDTNRHGTHVAGIAAGNPIEVTFEGVDVNLSGVAPGAYLMVYKALFDNGGIVTGSDAMLLAALEHAVKDGADVINNSWGSIQDESPEESVYTQVFSTAEQLGVVIVNSAGNNGSLSDNAINCPGCIESGITVANSTVGRIFGHKLRIDDTEFPAYSGDTQLSFDDMQLTLGLMTNGSGEPADGCSAAGEGAFSGLAVLVDYTNACPLDTIVSNVAEAGGSAVLVYQDNVSDFETLRPFNQFSGEFSLPLLGLTRADGRMLRQKALTQNNQILISGSREALLNQALYNQLNPSSSVGPNLNPNVLKPDITAPGTDTLSAAAPEPDVGFPMGSLPSPSPQNNTPAFALISGTSMSSPMVAGAAALIRQAHPDWSSKQIKTALISTAKAAVKVNQQPASPFEQGAGMLDIPAAINAALTFESGSYAHGACVASCSFTNVVTNVSDTAQSWTVDIQLDDPQATFTLQQQSLTLARANTPGASANLAFSIDTSDVENGKWVFGKVEFSQGNSLTQQLPIAIFANDNSDTRALSSNLSVAQNGDLSATTRVRNIDFVQDPSLSVSVPDFATIIPGSIQAEVSNGQTYQLAIGDDGKLHWQGALSTGSMSLQATTPWNAPTLKSTGVQPVFCQDGCTAFSTQVDFPFTYHGEQYPGITVSSNGFIVAGQIELGPFDANRVVEFPSEDNLNNVIAPLWADYDLRDPNDPSDNGEGALYIDTIDWQGERYLVVEWNQVAPFGSDEEGRQPYTFQVVIKENSDEILFNYFHVVDPINATIGAENSDATLGVNYLNTVTETSLPIPISGAPFSLALSTQPTGMADIDYKIALEDAGINTQPDAVTLDEDEVRVIDVLNNDNAPRDVVVSAELWAAKQITQASRLIKIPMPALDTSTLAIVTPPQQGQASVVDGRIQYTPVANFNGTDLLEYQVADENGALSASTSVALSITAVNDAPNVSDIAAQTVDPGTSVTLTAQGSDIENDPLTWSWEQTQGPEVTMSADGNQMSFTAPDTSSGASLVFSVTASDGQLSSAPQSARVTVRATNSEPPGSGSGGGVLFSLLALMVTAITRSFLKPVR
ncbi:S8 family serine peptidase [Lacimicrobium alkaliphilum]|uniref:Peptidase S8/S53 domain-containing protein n=1 Tax=Lacimicrobium alkaliphilum TaxID=1526571 RepID=A0ABQ1RI04_9ALTE|nr:S8 family serine peptidase [Lacimicrobium alkaliphilum]GGD71026.1 hypothetical protein GCM10011357_27640 [Lacimicrobium alkaliphilum]